MNKTPANPPVDSEVRKEIDDILTANSIPPALHLRDTGELKWLRKDLVNEISKYVATQRAQERARLSAEYEVTVEAAFKDWYNGKITILNRTFKLNTLVLNNILKIPFDFNGDQYVKIKLTNLLQPEEKEDM